MSVNSFYCLSYKVAAFTAYHEHVVKIADLLSKNGILAAIVAGVILSGILDEYKKVKAELKAKAAEKKELVAEQKNCGIHFIWFSYFCVSKKSRHS